MNNLMAMVFKGCEVEVFEFEDKVLFNPYHCGNCLKMTKDSVRKTVSRMNPSQIVKLSNSKVTDRHFRKLHNTGENFITESGVYKLIFKSQSKEAEKFQDWVTDEVLPQIRKTGGYIPVTPEDDKLTIMSKAFLIATDTIEMLQQNEIKNAPKVLFADTLRKSKDNISIGEFAKTLCDGGFEIGQNRLFKWLKDKKFLLKDNMPYQQYIVNGAFQVKRGIYFEFGGVPKQSIQTVITPKGQLYLFKKLKKDFDFVEIAS